MKYLIQVSISWVLFFALYYWWLRKETFHVTNRWYLVGSLIFGLVIPWMTFPFSVMKETLPAIQVVTHMGKMIDIQLSSPSYQSTETKSWNYIFWIWMLGMMIASLRFIWGHICIFKMYFGASEKIKMQKITLVRINEDILPFSFYKWVFLPKRIKAQESLDIIIHHEENHAKEWHSLDITLIQVLSIPFWFNPITRLYKKALRQVHENIVDQICVESDSKIAYIRLLTSWVFKGKEISLGNNFFTSLINQRIMMIYKKPSPSIKRVKYLFTVPLIAGILILFSCNKEGKPYDNLKYHDTKSLEKNDLSWERLYVKVDQMPRFPGCEEIQGNLSEKDKCAQQKMLDFIYSHAKYPDKAKDEGIEGMVVVRFIVEKDGNITGKKILKGLSPELDEEVLRVVEQMPRWIPGKNGNKKVNVRFTLPIKFKLE